MEYLRKSLITSSIIGVWLVCFISVWILHLDVIAIALSFSPVFPNFFTGIFTHILLMENPLVFLISAPMFFLFGSILEREWGAKWYSFFVIAIAFATWFYFEITTNIVGLVSGGGLGFYLMPSDGWILSSAVIIAWCVLNMEQKVRFWFIIPIQAKWIILVTAIVMIISHGWNGWFPTGILFVGGMIAAYFYARAMIIRPYGHQGKRISRGYKKSVVSGDFGQKSSVTDNRERKRRTKQLNKVFKIDE